jgi:hypothetical protein
MARHDFRRPNQSRKGASRLGSGDAGRGRGRFDITIKRLEAAGEDIHAHFATVMKVKSAFENAGVLFLGEESGLGYGVRLRDLTSRRRGKPPGKSSQ